MVHGVVPPFYDTVATRVAKQLDEHQECLGIVKLNFGNEYGKVIVKGAFCAKCTKKDFPKTVEEMKRKIENVRQSVKYE